MNELRVGRVTAHGAGGHSVRGERETETETETDRLTD